MHNFFQISLKYFLRIFGHDKNAQKYGFSSLFTLVMLFFLKKDTPYLALEPWKNEALGQIVISIISSFMICFRYGSKRVNAIKAVCILRELCKRLMRVYFENVGIDWSSE